MYGATRAMYGVLRSFAISELLGERLIGDFGFGENDQAGGRFVESMDNGETGPTRLTVAKPFEKTFARVRRG